MKFAIAFLLVGLAACTPPLLFDMALPQLDPLRVRHPELFNKPEQYDANTKIVGGVNAEEGEAPYQIALFRSGVFQCGGELIGPQTVLTAAHCVFGYEAQASLFTIRYGSLDRNSGTLVQVTKVIRHENYDSSITDNDVAILSLASAYSPSNNAAVIALVDSDPADGSSLTVTGWGALYGQGPSPSQLQKADGLKVVNRAECHAIWNAVDPRIVVTDNMLCAIATTQSACNGDSGGPITQNGALVGVVSWGARECLHATRPNVYARVAQLKSWILANS